MTILKEEKKMLKIGHTYEPIYYVLNVFPVCKCRNSDCKFIIEIYSDCWQEDYSRR